MVLNIFSFLNTFEDFLWGYIGVPMLVFLGIWLTFQSNFFQIRKLPYVIRKFITLLAMRKGDQRGIHPLKAFFASIGGCVGVGNIAGICTAIQIGGPGALFWIWVTAIIGMIIKYAEVYLGMRYRVSNNSGGYNGGPMYFLQHVFKNPFIPTFVAILLCIYGVEVYQFSIVANNIVSNLGFNKYIVVFGFLGLVLFAGSGGIKRVGGIASTMIPLFVTLYIGMGIWVLLNNLSAIPIVFEQVMSSAFTEAAAFGGFAGSTLMMTISHGMRRGCYTGDLGVGYASVIHSESCTQIPQEQAALAVFDIFIDTFCICTTSVMIILVTGVWHEPVDSSGIMIQAALSQYFPYMNLFMPLFVFLLGYTTINAYFCVGLKCAEFVSPKHGKKVYYVYAVIALLIFSFVGVEQAQTIMTIVNGLLLIINCYGIFHLRHEISFKLGDKEELVLQEQESEDASLVKGS